jgi:hypothetical protein
LKREFLSASDYSGSILGERDLGAHPPPSQSSELFDHSGYVTGVVYVGASVCLLINKEARRAAAWAGVFVLFAVIVFCVPIMVQHGSDIGNGLNVPVDTLLLSGAVLCLAGSQPKKSLA